MNWMFDPKGALPSRRQRAAVKPHVYKACTGWKVCCCSSILIIWSQFWKASLWAGTEILLEPKPELNDVLMHLLGPESSGSIAIQSEFCLMKNKEARRHLLRYLICDMAGITTNSRIYHFSLLFHGIFNTYLLTQLEAKVWLLLVIFFCFVSNICI